MIKDFYTFDSHELATHTNEILVTRGNCAAGKLSSGRCWLHGSVSLHAMLVTASKDTAYQND